MAKSTDLPQGFHVYGASASAKFEIAHNASRQPVLALDVAGRVPGREIFDWANKISLQVTDREMPNFMCALLGILPVFDVRNHGPNKNKSFRLENQPEKGVIYLRVSDGSDSLSLPVSPDKVFHLSALGLKVLSLQSQTDIQTSLLLLRGTTGRLINGMQ